MRACSARRRTPRSVQLSLFPPEFTDVSAIITRDRAFALFAARINRRVQWNEGKREGERKVVESAPWRREDVAGKGKQKRKRLETPRDLIRLVGKIQARGGATRWPIRTTGNGPSVVGRWCGIRLRITRRVKSRCGYERVWAMIET